MSHPEAITHSIIGDVAAYGFIRALMDSSSANDESCGQPAAPKMFHPDLQTVEYCPTPTAGSPATPGTFMSAFQASVFEPVVAGGWLWREDVPGKPGAPTSVVAYLCGQCCCCFCVQRECWRISKRCCDVLTMQVGFMTLLSLPTPHPQLAPPKPRTLCTQTPVTVPSGSKFSLDRNPSFRSHTSKRTPALHLLR